MNCIRKIAPVLLLCVFSITQLHAVIPHKHHNHDSNNEGLDVEHHHHHNDHHSHDEPFNDSHNHDNTSDEFVAHFLDSHSHQDIHHEVIVLVDNVKLKKKSNSNFLITDFAYKIAVPEKERKPIVKGISDVHSLTFYLSSFSLRGPPVLV